MSAIARQTEITTGYAADVVGNLVAVPELNMHGMAGGRIYVPSGSPITTINFYDAPYHSSQLKIPPTQTPVQYGSPAGTFLASIDQSTGSQVSLTVQAGKSYDIPAAMFGCGAMKLIVNAAGSLDVCLKG